MMQTADQQAAGAVGHDHTEPTYRLSAGTDHPIRSCLDLTSPREKSNWTSFRSTGQAVVLQSEEIAAILQSADPQLQSLRERVADQGEIGPRERDIFVLAKASQEDGEVEFDETAAISEEGGDNGAYVSGWFWVSFSDTPLDKEAVLVRLTLVMADGTTGISLYRDDGTEKPMTWDGESDTQTVSATFEVMRGGEAIVAIPLDGDQWRDLESEGYVVDIVNGLLNGENDAVQHALDELRGVDSAPLAQDRGAQS